MLGLTFSSKLDWASYIISVTKKASKKIGALICSMKFLPPETALYLYKFPLTYDLSGFKSRINRHLVTVGSFQTNFLYVLIFCASSSCNSMPRRACPTYAWNESQLNFFTGIFQGFYLDFKNTVLAPLMLPSSHIKF